MAKALKVKDLRAMKADELAKYAAELQKELMKLRSQVASKTQLENPGRIGTIRRMLARLATLQREKELQGGVSA